MADGAVPLEDFADLKSEVHSLRRDVGRIEFGENAILARLLVVEREVHLLSHTARWGFGLLAALIVTAAGALLVK